MKGKGRPKGTTKKGQGFKGTPKKLQATNDIDNKVPAVKIGATSHEYSGQYIEVVDLTKSCAEVLECSMGDVITSLCVNKRLISMLILYL